jgi:Skp family chaperone for outer membrane proteins
LSIHQQKQLLAAVEELIKKHGNKNPALLRDLNAFKAQLDAVSAQPGRKEFAKIALSIAGWIKFIYDLLSDEPP